MGESENKVFEYRYYLGTSETNGIAKGHHALNLKVGLKENEYRVLYEASNRLNRFINASSFYNMVVWNFEDMWATRGFYLISYAVRDIRSFHWREIDLNLNRCLINFLSMGADYRTYFKKYIKDNYDTNLGLIKKFEKYCTEEFEENIYYRLCSKLRDFSVHYTLPIGNINLGAKPDDENKNAPLYYLNVFIDRDALLESGFKWGGKMREDILGLPKLIDIFLFSLSYLNSLKRIHSRIVKDVFFELKSFAQLIIDWGNRIDPKSGDYILIDLRRKGIKQLDSFSQSPFPFQVAERILSEDFEGLFPIQK